MRADPLEHLELVGLGTVHVLVIGCDHQGAAVNCLGNHIAAILKMCSGELIIV